MTLAFAPITPLHHAVSRSSVSATATSFTPARRHSGVTAPRTRAAVAPSATTVRMSAGAPSVTEALEAAGIYSGLLQLAAAAGVDLNQAAGNATLFAPTNAGLARTPPGFVATLLADAAGAGAVLSRHVVPGGGRMPASIKGMGNFDFVMGGPLPYDAVSGPALKVGDGVPVVMPVSPIECAGGAVIIPLDGVLSTPLYKRQSVSQYFIPPPPTAPPLSGHVQKRAVGAAAQTGVAGARKAMGLIKQQPFWMYGPPFNAAKQEEYEPISIAQPEGAAVDYQVFPPGSVIVTPDSTSAAEMLPVSGYSKYIGKTQKLVEGDAESDYSRLD